MIGVAFGPLTAPLRAQSRPKTFARASFAKSPTKTAYGKRRSKEIAAGLTNTPSRWKVVRWAKWLCSKERPTWEQKTAAYLTGSDELPIKSLSDSSPAAITPGYSIFLERNDQPSLGSISWPAAIAASR